MAAIDVGADLRERRLACGEVGILRDGVVRPEGRRGANANGHEHANLAVPGQLAETQVDRHIVFLGIGAAVEVL
jgi:hypothetical protein